MFAGSGLTKLALAAGGAALLSGPLSSPETWVIGRSPYTPPAATRLVGTANLASLSRLDNAKGIVLDIEDWPLTPRRQREDPVAAYRRAFSITQKNHQFLVATPATDLVHSVEPQYHGPIYPEFLRLGLAEKIASSCKVYEIQAQGAERNPSLYAYFVKEVAAQIRDAHPDVVLLAGLSTNPGGHPVPARVLEKDVQATREIVAGYWLNIPQAGKACPRCGKAHPEIAVSLLNNEFKKMHRANVERPYEVNGPRHV